MTQDPACVNGLNQTLDQASATYGTRAKRGTIFNGTLSELKYSNYDLIKNWIFN